MFGRVKDMINPIDVQIKMLDAELPAPSYTNPGDAGADLRSRVDFVLAPGERALVPTGIAIALPEGYVGLVHPRSGLATKHGITIVNAPGTVDSGYRGELMVTLLNTDRAKSFQIKRGDRIAQLVIQRYEHANFVVVENLDETERGSQGFGSSGLK
ncbi:deoxyuridine 5'-triphosphate nucleotidohydrolase [Rothia sp. HMSC065G12]|nr:deoxyuridine 5'-triphosphate nucleotidohydrolase [Rothia sp. HMSC065G12]